MSARYQRCVAQQALAVKRVERVRGSERVRGRDERVRETREAYREECL
jgi:hypothetical protein